MDADDDDDDEEEDDDDEEEDEDEDEDEDANSGAEADEGAATDDAANGRLGSTNRSRHSPSASSTRLDARNVSVGCQ